MNWKSILPFVLLVGLAGCKPPADEAEKTPTPKAAVQVAEAVLAPVEEGVDVDGQFTFSEGAFTRVAPSVAGRWMDVRVKEGDRVRKGQVIATVDVRVLSAQTRSAEAARAVATAQTRQSEASLRASEADQGAQVRLARVALEAAMEERATNVRQAQLDLARIEAGARPQEIAQAEQAVVQARIAHDRAKTEADRDARLFREGYVSGQQADASRAASATAASALRQAQSQLELVKAGARPEERAAARERLRSAAELGDKKVAQAKEVVKQAEAGALSVAAKRAEVEASRRGADQKAADLAAAAAGESNGTVLAPIDGWVARRLANPGDMADPASPVVEIAATETPIDFVGQVTADVAGRISVGASISGGGGTGRVVAIGVVNSQTGLAPVRAKYGKIDVKPGAFATAKVTTRKIASTVVIPKVAVIDRDGKTIVFVVAGDVAKLREVEVGPVAGERIAIAKGLKAGEKVVVLGQFELSDGVAIEVKSE